MRIIISIIIIVLIVHLLLRTINSRNKESFYQEERPIRKNKCFQELIDYVDKCKKSNVKPNNYWVNDENSANFMSNVLNTHKFYDIDLSTNDKCTDTGTNTSTYNMNKIEDQTCFPKRTGDNLEPFMPDNWNYKNELPMNGGTIVGNVVGFDSLNTGYSTFGTENIVNLDCQNRVDCNLPSDDIRFGLGYPNKEYRDIR